MTSTAASLREYGRGLAGGLIFSLPLLYTMEVWWAGFMAQPSRMLIYLAAVFLLLLGYNRYAGIREDASFAEVAIDSVEELGLGVVTAAVTLLLLGRIGTGQALEEVVGQVVIEAGIVAIGFSVGTSQLGGAGEKEDSGLRGRKEGFSRVGGQVVVAFCGAVLFAANVAPTEEIVLIALETTTPRLIALAVASLAIGALILFFSDFAGAGEHSAAESHRDVLAGMTITYAIALISSAAILWFFGRFDGDALDVCIRETVVLGFPATMGASAGRLLLQQS